MSFFKNIFNKIIPSSTKNKEIAQHSNTAHHHDSSNITISHAKQSGGLLDVLFSPIRAVTNVVSKVLDIFPDPTKTGTLYDGVNSTYNAIAQTVINLPSNILGKIPVVSVVGDVAGSILSAGFKAVGIVADHTIMMAANVVEVAKAGVVGSVNILDKSINGQAHVEFNGQSPETLDSIKEVASHSASYTINNLESHLVHDIDLIATIPDLLIDIIHDVENNLKIDIPGSDFLNHIVDSSVVNIRDTLIDGVIGNAIKISEGIGLTHTNAGIMRHEAMDHVGEGNIREGYPMHGSHADHSEHSNQNQQTDHSQHGNQNKQTTDHSQHGNQNKQTTDQSQHSNQNQHTDHSQHANQNQHAGHSHATQYDLSVTKFLPDLNTSVQLY
ncbi:MAG: hypothetical protein H9855_11380 [Candidatus Acinetobacter avistercoris]|uniref:hypothetical protein n=1 Tax=Acinetobacter sp. KS-LM10 TaxID=3120518 RepID=UPI001F89AB7A|nr:hypothetical protein [Candidatus Acinetobacter avistercoris]